MLIEFLGGDSAFFQAAFFNDRNNPTTLTALLQPGQSATRAVYYNPDTGAATTIRGTALSYDALTGQITGGTITEVVFEQNAAVVARFSNFSFAGADVSAALVAMAAGNHQPLDQLMSQGPLTVDASAASNGLHMAGLPFDPASDMTVIGSSWEDVLEGGAGNDLIRTGNGAPGPVLNVFGEIVVGTAGNDTIDFAGSAQGTFQYLDYLRFTSAITADIDITANTGTVSAPGSTDTLLNLQDAARGEVSVYLAATAQDDVLTVRDVAGGWIGLVAGQGNDTFNLTLEERIRISYIYGTSSNFVHAQQGVVADLSTGVVSNDGFGFTDRINILGGSGRLEFQGSDNDDFITGSARDEIFILRRGADTLDAGAGWDTLRYDRNGIDGAVSVDLQAGTASGQWLSTAFTHLISGIEEVHGSDLDDTIAGDGQDNLLRGFAGADSLSGGAGNDSLIGNQGNDVLIGGVGHDQLTGGLGDDTLRADAGNDVLVGDAGNDSLFGGKGFDTLRGGVGNDTVIGGDGRDKAYLGDGNDVFIDNAQGGVLGRDTVYANAGNDAVHGGNGNDVFFGQKGNDLLLGRKGGDRLFGGDQNDTLAGGDGNDTVAGGNGRDRAFLGNGDDIWFDNAQVQFGDDYVQGGTGNDTLRAGGGNDTLAGGAGADVFVFSGAGFNADTVADFTTGSDVLNLSATLWTGSLTAAQVVAQFASVTTTGVVFDFGAGDTITLTGLITTTGLEADLVIV